MVRKSDWQFYGRHLELVQMKRDLARNSGLFLQISGCHRIARTAFIKPVLAASGYEKTLYIQIPDSDAAGILAAYCADHSRPYPRKINRPGCHRSKPVRFDRYIPNRLI
jgi:hypothetical protein